MWCRGERTPEQVQQAMAQCPGALQLHRHQVVSKAQALTYPPPLPAICNVPNQAQQWVLFHTATYSQAL